MLSLLAAAKRYGGAGLKHVLRNLPFDPAQGKRRWTTGTSSSHNRLRLLTILTVFLLLYLPSRLFLLLHFTPIGTDVDLYARYAYYHSVAHETGDSFYSVYRSAGQRDSVWSCYTLRDLTEVVYPPLAIEFITVPTRFAAHGHPDTGLTLEAFVPRYQAAYRLLCAAVEVVSVLVGLWLIVLLYRNENVIETVVRAGMLCGAGVLLPHLLYDRLDIVLAALLTISLAALFKRQWLLSFFLFALAVCFKPTPIFLAPLWVLGSITVPGPKTEARSKRLFLPFAQAASRGGVLCLMIIILFGLFIVIEGNGGLGFLRYHEARGLHIESVWGTGTLLFARIFDMPFHITYDFGSFGVVAPVTPFFVALAPPLLVVVTGIFSLLIFLLGGRQDAGDASGPHPFISPRSMVLFSAGFLGTVFCLFKMFSPQFLLLLVPLVALVPLRGAVNVAFCAVFTGLCCMSTFIYPYFYMNEIINGPTPFGLYLLVSRAVMLCSCTGVLLAIAFIPAIRKCSEVRWLHKL